MEHVMRLQAEPFAKIKSGEKTIEMRLYDAKRRQIQVGDTVVFYPMDGDGEKITVKAIALHLFDSFADLYAGLDLTKCGYNKENLAAASPKDMELYYTPAQQTQYGVVGIEIEKL